MKLVLGLLLALCANTAHAHLTGGPSEVNHKNWVDAAGECVINLDCEECLPENMPAVLGAGGDAAVLRVPTDGEVRLSCGSGHFLLYARAEIRLRCESSAWRVIEDGVFHRLLELGCQHDALEDVQHAVRDCAPPLQGRAYLWGAASGTQHLAALCYDEDRAIAVHARTSLAGHMELGAHNDVRAPLSLFGNFNEMFDAGTRHAAERLFGDEARATRRLHELWRHAHVAWAGESLRAVSLLAPSYFPVQHARAAHLVSNRVLSWRSIEEGNLRHLQADVGALRGGAFDVVAGTHGVLAVPAGGTPRPGLYLGAGGRFPIPRYIWTLVHSQAKNEGVALVLLNDPFVQVSEIREAVFCDSVCGQISWLKHLLHSRNYERPILGLVFCCRLTEFARHVPIAPRLHNDTVRLLDYVTQYQTTTQTTH